MRPCLMNNARSKYSMNYTRPCSASPPSWAKGGIGPAGLQVGHSGPGPVHHPSAQAAADPSSEPGRCGRPWAASAWGQGPWRGGQGEPAQV